MTEAISAIGTVGFPIVACIVMAYYVKYLTDKHREEQERLTEIINNNTLAVQKLCDKLDMKGEN